MNITDEQLYTLVTNRLGGDLKKLKRTQQENIEDELQLLFQLFGSILIVIKGLSGKEVQSYAIPKIVQQAKKELDARIDQGGDANQMLEDFYDHIKSGVGIADANPIAIYNDPKATYKRFRGRYSITRRMMYSLFDFCRECNIPIHIKYESFSDRKYYFNDFFIACNNLLHEICEEQGLEYNRDIEEITIRDLIKKEYIIFKRGKAILRKPQTVLNKPININIYQSLRFC